MEEINISCFQDVIDNYEKLVKELTTELSNVKNEHEQLKLKITEVIADNKNISEELSNTLKQREEGAKVIFQEENKLLDNLKGQLEKTLQEKEYTLKLWQNAVQTIDSLEEELRIYQAGIDGFLPKKEYFQLKTTYEDKIKSLERKLAIAEKKFEQTLRQSTTEIEVKKHELDKTLENQVGAIQIIKNLEKEVLALQLRLQECSHTKDKFQKLIQQKEDDLKGLRIKNNECIAKVTEAVNVVESALMEKDGALLREQNLKDEIKNINNMLSKIEKETKNKIKNESDILKTECDEKIANILKQLQSAQEEVKIKSIEAEKISQKCNSLENEIQRLQKGNINIDESNTSKLLLLEKNLESTFQKLLISEKQNIQLAAEKDSIKNDIDQMADIYERNLKGKEIEIGTLKSRIKQLSEQLEQKKADTNILNEKAQSLQNQVELLEDNIKIQKDNYEKLLISSQEEKIAGICMKHNEEIKDFQTKLDIKDELIKKWRTETRSIVNDLQKVINDLKLEITDLKQENKKLKQKSEGDNQKLNQYKIFLDVISQDVNKISSLTVNKNI